MSSIETWQSVAEDVLAPLLVEQYIEGKSEYFESAYMEEGLFPHHFPNGRWRSLYSCIVQLRNQKKAVNWNNLSSIVSSTVNSDWFTDVSTLADPIRMLDFDDNVAKLIEIGNRMTAVDSLEQAADNLRRGEDLQFTIQSVIDDITTVGERRIENETAEGASEAVDQIFESDPVVGAPTGIEFIDDSIGGLIAGRMMMLAGAYKSRKTTCMINWILSAYRAGKLPAILSFENSKQVTTMQIIAMLAIEYLFEQKKIAYTSEASAFWISADQLMRMGKTYKQKWAGLKAEAVEYARDTFRDMKKGIRIYDQSHKGGNLSDIDSCRSVIIRDMHLYGGNIFAIDHQGLIDAPSKEIYEGTRYVSKQLMKISRYSDPHPISLLVLAQLNEETIKSNTKKEKYTTGIKGGGDTNANADYVIRTTPVPDPINRKFHNDRVEIQVKLTRWSGGTGKHIVKFHPESGLLMPDQLGTSVPQLEGVL